MELVKDPRFIGLVPFEQRLWLSSPTMHGEEQHWVNEAIRTNWVSTVGENINEIERQIAELIGVPYAVALSSGTAALHLAVRLAGRKLYGSSGAGRGALEGKKVFASDMTFSATVNPICYEGGEPVFIDSERDTWNMDPAALEKAFRLHPEVRLIVAAHLYGTPAKMDEIRRIADEHGALIVEDAAESLGSLYHGAQTGSFGDISAISFNGNKMITGSTGGMILLNDGKEAELARKWSTQSREKAPWYQHKDLGYNYRMSNIVAGVVRGQLPHLEEHIEQKRTIFERYAKGLSGLPVSMAPAEADFRTNRWLSCMLIDEDAMCASSRGSEAPSFSPEAGKTCPDEILSVLLQFNAEGRPIWKPMHMQPVFEGMEFVSAAESAVNEDIFARGLCLPSDNKITEEEQTKVIELIRRCFG